MSELAVGGGGAGSTDPSTLRIIDGYLVRLTQDCTCSGGAAIGIGVQHEPGCGLEPLPAGLDMDGLADDISTAMWHYGLDVDIRPHLPAFLAAVLRSAS